MKPVSLRENVLEDGTHLALTASIIAFTDGALACAYLAPPKTLLRSCTDPW